MTDRAGPSHSILQFLSEIFKVLFLALENRDTTENCIINLNILEGKASTITEILDRYGKGSTEAYTNASNMLKLYQMAVMVYLARVSESISTKPRNIQPLLDGAFTLLCQLGTCELHFPLLILGYEARTDEQRVRILDLVRRTEKKTYGRNIDCLRRSLEALWVQEDLFSDQEFVPKYTDRLSAIVSKTGFIPSLV